MKNNRRYLWISILSSLIFTSTADATGFLEVYYQALKNDPTFQKAQATWQSQKMSLPIARSGALPQLLALGNYTRQYTFNAPNSLSTISDYNWAYGYSLKVTQPILDLATWDSIRSASAVVKAATASYIAAQQSLMQRTAQAYIDVLKAYETLHYTIVNKKAIWDQYIASEKKFNAGLIAVMDVYDAKSRYDQITAQEISARNNLSNKLEALHAITGNYYTSLNGLKTQLKLIKPDPIDVDAWTDKAVKQNYNLTAQRYNVISAMEKIGQASAGGMPTLDLSSGFSEDHQEDNQMNQTLTDETSLGVNVTYKPIQGGLVYSSTKQARYNYVAASAELGVVYRQVVNQTHNNFSGIMSSLLRVQADRLRIVSAQKALVATEAGLKVGARTMVDVLNDLTTLYQSQQQFADDQYTYLTNYIDLKVAAGSLSVADLARIDHWMTRKIMLKKINTHWATFNLQQMNIKLDPKKAEEAISEDANMTNQNVDELENTKKEVVKKEVVKSTVSESVKIPMPQKTENTEPKPADDIIHIPGLDHTYQQTLKISDMPQHTEK